MQARFSPPPPAAVIVTTSTVVGYTGEGPWDYRYWQLQQKKNVYRPYPDEVRHSPASLATIHFEMSWTLVYWAHKRVDIYVYTHNAGHYTLQAHLFKDGLKGELFDFDYTLSDILCDRVIIQCHHFPRHGNYGPGYCRVQWAA